MTVKEFYQSVGGNYDDVMSRLRTEERVVKFLNKVLADGSFELLKTSLDARNLEDAFRAAHTIKGVCMNMSLTKLYESAANLTEALRGRTEYGDDIVPLFDKLAVDYKQNIDGIKQIQL